MKYLGKFIRNFVAFAFLLALIITFGASFFPESEKLAENRNLAEFPEKIDFNFPRDFEKYYQDNFPRRHKFIKKYNKFRYKKFHINNFVIFGKEGWLYYNSDSQEESDSIGDYLGRNLYDPKNLDMVAGTLKSQIKKMEALGAEVFVVVPPNKMTVYPQYMPEEYQTARKKGSRLEQIEQRLPQEGIRILPLRNKIINDAKQPDFTLYLKTDSHWNNLGGYLAYQEIMRGMKIAPYKYTDLKEQQVECGDLNGFVKMDGCADLNYELKFQGRPEFKCENVGSGKKNQDHSEIIRCHSQVGNNTKLLVVRDSFWNAVYSYVAPHFKDSVILWRGHLENEEIEAIIKAEKPDVIILEYVERFIDNMSQIVIQN